MTLVEPRFRHCYDRDLYCAFYEADAYIGAGLPMDHDEPRLIWVKRHITPKADIIDIGCNKGEMTVLIRPLTAGRVVGLDISQNAIRWAQEHHAAEIEWRVGEAEALPYPDNSFDIAILCEILEHLPDPDIAIREAERVVRPDGLVIVSVPANAVQNSLRDIALRDPKDYGDLVDLSPHFWEILPSVKFRMKKDLRLANAQTGIAHFRMASYRVVK